MIQLNLFNQNYSLDNFPERKSQLDKRKDKLTLKISIYPQTPEETTKEINFFKNLKELPKSLMISKTKYFWELEGVTLQNIVVKPILRYYEHTKISIELTIRYNRVHGTNNYTVLKRQQSLNELFNF